MKYDSMDISLIVFLVIGIAVGWLAKHMMHDKGHGRIWDIVAGLVGALLGGVLFTSASVSSGESMLGSLIVATLTAMTFTFGLRLFKKRS